MGPSRPSLKRRLTSRSCLLALLRFAAGDFFPVALPPGADSAAAAAPPASPGAVYAVYAVSSLDTDPPLTIPQRSFVGTQQGVAGLTPGPSRWKKRPGLETGSHNGHVHLTRMLICMHNWGSSLHLPPHRRSSIIVMRMHSRSSSRDAAASTSGGEIGWSC